MEVVQEAMGRMVVQAESKLVQADQVEVHLCLAISATRAAAMTLAMRAAGNHPSQIRSGLLHQVPSCQLHRCRVGLQLA